MTYDLLRCAMDLDVAQDYELRDPDLRKYDENSTFCLRSRADPSDGGGGSVRSDRATPRPLEMVTPEVLAKSASRERRGRARNLKNGMGHQRWTPTASSDEEPGRLMVVNFFPAATTPLPRHIGETGL